MTEDDGFGCRGRTSKIERRKKDCLLMLVFKDKSEKSKGHKERNSVTLEDICGLDPGLSLEGVNHILAIICLGQTVLLAFENKETMYVWDMRTRYSLGEVHRFHVSVLPGTKLESGPATLHFCNNIFVLVRDVPPTIIGQWKLSDMRRYGAIPNGFVFEGGSRCGLWAGVFCLSCAEGERISFLFDCIVRGISPTKGPFGLRPILPDPSTSQAYTEERISHEALELEKRLSLLSQSSRQSSGGDDRSLSSSTESSDTSQSDSASLGSRMTLWPEQLPVSGLQEGQSLGTAAKGLGAAEEKLYAEVTRGSKPPPKPPRSRKLQEVGRQSSSDSGIATASHSSYSGSFSSYAGSQSDEFGSLLSLPSAWTAEQTLCTCEMPGSEYQVPSSARHHYDTPRSVLQAAVTKETPPSPATKDQAPAPHETADAEWCKSFSAALEGAELSADVIPKWTQLKPRGQTPEATGGEATSLIGVSVSGAGTTDPCEIYSPYPGTGRALFTACLTCGGLKGTTASPSGASSIPAAPDKKQHQKEEKLKMGTGQMYEFMEALPTEKPSELEKGGGYEYMASCGQQKLQVEGEGPPGSLKLHRGQGAHLDIMGLKHKKEKGLPEDETSGSFDTKKLSGGAFAYPPELSGTDRLRPMEGATYVNIPVSPASKKQLHYMELELQESSPAIRGASSSKYAQIDITATETAHKVGTQHAQHREERLQELEQKRKGPAPQ
ncbi:protein Dok-7 isoform X2 [Chiloscyllium plagiosum]|uniref:protein Dok-7 isoform X2 n=1 Tax=Chiloscyllium plagiosum TaxID=36176 RepID=UPI001CB843BB|nr:protein Dok-7 isoform X2 [Chiloscyllium plagiosum]